MRGDDCFRTLAQVLKKSQRICPLIQVLTLRPHSCAVSRESGLKTSFNTLLSILDLLPNMASIRLSRATLLYNPSTSYNLHSRVIQKFRIRISDYTIQPTLDFLSLFQSIATLALSWDCAARLHTGGATEPIEPAPVVVKMLDLSSPTFRDAPDGIMRILGAVDGSALRTLVLNCTLPP